MATATEDKTTYHGTYHQRMTDMKKHVRFKINEIIYERFTGIDDGQDNPNMVWYQRQDVWGWSLGMVFICQLMAAMMGLGYLRGWDANSGFEHNQSLTSPQRFTPEPFEDEPGVHGRNGWGRVSRWYYWKLPLDQVTILTRMFVWTCYSAHQIFMWTIIYLAQVRDQERSLSGKSPKEPQYSNRMNRYNIIALLGNIFFHILHLVQTHISYDALAQDVSVTSSQASVIILLVYVILIEYKDRRLFLGWPARHHTGPVSSLFQLRDGPIYIVRKYHGYGFAWAAIYTFWYHPMENTLGHVVGFIHTWMILLQGSLMYTNFHLHKWWRFLLETWVTLHGSLVAYQTNGANIIWPMFLFGFLTIVSLTQIFSFQFWQKIKWYWRFLPMVATLIFASIVYTLFPDQRNRTIQRMFELCFIPSAMYSLPLICHGLLSLCLKIETAIKQKLYKPSRSNLNSPQSSSIIWRIVKILLSFSVFVNLIFFGFLVQYLDIKLDMIVIMNILSLVYGVGFLIFLMLIKQLFKSDGETAFKIQ